MSTVVPPRIRSYAPALAACERHLAMTIAATGPALAEPASQTLSAGGKRLRPLLVYCCGGATEGHDELTAAAVAVELVHMATLVHDDVLDQSALRRGRPTVFVQHGRNLAEQTGDFLFATAFGELARTQSASAVSTLAHAASDLARGEIAQTIRTGDVSVSAEEYLERVRLKTAALFSAACRLGANLGGASDEEADLLSEYGARIGIAFQILDDILDVTTTEEVLGKPRGADLRDGTVTLPMILAMREEPELSDQIVAAMNGGPSAELCELLAEHPATDAARAAALDLVEQAHEIARSPGVLNADRGALEDIATGVVERYA